MSIFNPLKKIRKNVFNITRRYAEDCGSNLRRRLLAPVQLENSKPRRKVSIIGGGGAVASATAYTMFRKLICDEIVLIDLKNRKDKLCGEALDIIHGTACFNAPKLKVGFDTVYAKNSDVIVIACGQTRKENQCRKDIAQQNVNLMKSIIPGLAKSSPEAVFVIVTNPVDIISYAVWQYSCFPKNRIIGTGTSIDSVRFRYNISKRLGNVHPKNIEANILFEHGELAVPIWSLTNVAGNRLTNIDFTIATSEDKNDWNSVYKDTISSGTKLISSKGGSFFTIALLVTRLVNDILKDSRTIYNVSLEARGMYGICQSIYISLPAVIGNRGISDVVQQVFDDEEISKFTLNVKEVVQQLQCIQF